jgi:hypothetical protein
MAADHDGRLVVCEQGSRGQPARIAQVDRDSGQRETVVDQQTLYVTDTGANQEAGSYYVDRPHHIKAFDVVDGWRLGAWRVSGCPALHPPAVGQDCDPTLPEVRARWGSAQRTQSVTPPLESRAATCR